VNFSTLKAMLRSPAHYRHAAQTPREDTAGLRLGRAVHLAVLQPELFESEVAVWPAENGRRWGRAWDAFREEHPDRTILTETEAAECVALAAAVRGHPLASALLSGGQAEASAQWTDAATGIDCKGLLDYVGPGGIVDLKTTRDASLSGFGRECWRYSYHLQAAFYVDGWAESHGGERLPFSMVAVEKEPPHVVVVYRVPEDVLDLGRQEIAGLLESVKRCRAEKRWPGYADAAVDLELPRWAIGDDDRDVSGLGLDFGEETGT
jgi:exodeoxyribonuclease VIII